MLSSPAFGWKSYISDIRFWIVLFFIVRLYGITNPPLEGASTWRQCDGLMIARNFYEHNSNILYPTVDVAGEKSGIVGCEFPILNYLIYLLSLPFGFHDWFGRLINLILSSIASYYYFKTIREYFGGRPAFISTIVLLVSMWFAYSRITIPDIFAASLCIISINQILRYFENGNLKSLISFLILATIGCLSKISAATLLTVLIVPMLSSNYRIKRKLALIISSSMIIATVFSWYFYWVPYLNLKYDFGTHFFMGQPVLDGIRQLIENWEITLKRFYETPLKYSGFIVFLVALYLIISGKDKQALIVFIVPFLSFFCVVLVSGWGFYVNAYYPIMFVPSMAFIIGMGVSKLKSKWAFLLISIIAIEGIANQAHVFTIREKMKPYLQIETILNNNGVASQDLIAINSNSQHDPTAMYFAHRKGWGFSNADLNTPEIIADIKAKGCKFILILNFDKMSKTELTLEKLYDSEEFVLYKL